MMGDIQKRKRTYLDRLASKDKDDDISSDHEHRWFFLQTRTELIEQVNSTNYIKKEFAYFVCNDCPESDGPNVIKTEVKNKADFNAAA